MKRVLQVMGGLKRGGLETFAMNVYHAIDRTKIQFDFLLTQVTDGDYEEEARRMGANIYYLPARNNGIKAYEQSLDLFFKEHHDYIAVHEHISSLTSIRPIYYAKKYGIPVRVLHSHSSSIQKSLRFHWLHTILHYVNKPKVAKWATHYLGCSDKALDWAYKYTGIRSRAHMINNGIDTEKYMYNSLIRTEVRREFNISLDDFVIGHVGRFIPLKNQTFLVDILEQIHKDDSTAKLLLIGEGETLDAVKNKVASKDLQDFVVFTGVRSDVFRLMQAMDIFVMPSWFEGLPVSLVEAQASGLPIVSSATISRDVDITQTIQFKSIEESAEDWAHSILLLRANHQRSNNLDKIIEAGFDSKTAVEQLIAIYTQND